MTCLTMRPNRRQIKEVGKEDEAERSYSNAYGCLVRKYTVC